MFRLLFISLLCMSQIHDDLERARSLFPLEAVMRRLGLEVPPLGKKIMSPFRVTDDPHWTVRRMPGGRLKAMDEATGERWDEVDLIRDAKGIPQAEALREYLVMAGVRREERRAETPASAPPSPEVPAMSAVETARASLSAALGKSKTKPAGPFDWQVCLEAMTPERRQELAEWRGWPVEHVDWLVGEKLVGLYDGKWAIPVEHGGKVIGVHYRQDNGDWLYSKGAKALPLVWGESGSMVVAFESQWDAYTLLLALDVRNQPGMRDHVKICVTRGASNAARLKDHYKRDACIGFQQNDPPPMPGEKLEGNWQWKAELAKVWPGVEWAAPPEGIKDLNDWCRAEGTPMLSKAYEAVMVPKRERQSTMSVHSLLEVDAMEDDPDGSWVGEELIAEGEAVSILGEGGVGKSRWTLQLIAHMILGKDFCGLDVKNAAYGKRWLILQGENRKRRIKHEIKAIKLAMGLSREDYEFVASRIFITTLLKPEDFDLDTSTPERLEEIQKVINDFRPDGVCADPLGDFTSEDMNVDEHMKRVAQNILDAVRAGNSKRVVMFVHHAITGKDGAAKAVGWDAASFGRNSKALFNKVRSQINIAKVDPEDDSRILIACGKNNNGKRFTPVGLVLKDSGMYEVDHDFDLEAWKEEVSGSSGKKGNAVTIPADVVARYVHTSGISQGNLEDKIYKEFGGAKATAKRAVQEAREKGLIRVGKAGTVWMCYPK